VTRPITLNGITVTPTAPSALAASLIMQAAPSSPVAEGEYDPDHGARVVILAASLAACWPEGTRWPGTVRPGRFPLTRIREFGETVINDLAAAGCTVAEILAAGAVCYVDAVIPVVARRQDAEAAALGNSEATPGPQSGESFASSASTG
jgi:hypothetical protein